MVYEPKNARHRSQDRTYSQISIRVEKYDIDCEAGINSFAVSGGVNQFNPDDYVYRFATTIYITGVCIESDEKKNQPIEVTIYGSVENDNEFFLKINDFHSLDKDGHKIYRKRGNLSIPVYSIPSGLGLLNRVRGKEEWIGWVRVTSQYAFMLISFLNANDNLYLSLTECKIGRTLWIYRIALQTTNPEEE